MGFVLRLLGRLLFVIIFVGAGIQKVQTPEQSANYLSSSYIAFHKWILNNRIFNKFCEYASPYVSSYIPLVKEYTSPVFVSEHSKLIITAVGYTQLLCSTLVFVGVPLAGFALYLFTLSTIVIIHNPFANQLNFHAEFVNAVLNIAIAGIALFIASDIRTEVSISLLNENSKQTEPTHNKNEHASKKPFNAAQANPKVTKQNDKKKQ